MKEHGEYLEDEYRREHFLHLFDRRVFFSPRACDKVNDLQSSPGKMLAETEGGIATLLE